MKRRTDSHARRAGWTWLAALALSLFSAAAPLAAQQQPAARPPAGQPPAAGPGEIRGSVVDGQSNAPIPAASVAVYADSVLVAGALARPDGSFRIQGLRPGTYVMKVTMMGYETRTSARISITPAAARVNTGPIRLSRGAVALQGITATADRQAATIAPDRNTYQSRQVAPAATTASEVLEAVPSVQVDADGRVSLRGNENVVVQINGRPSPLRGTQLAGYLKQLPANTLDRVEVIPNPSARQDPEGMAGIINIVLKQNVDLGLSGGLTLAASTADRYTASGNLGYQQGPATFFASYGFNSDDRSVTGLNDRTRLAAGSPLHFTNQDISGSNNNHGHNFNGTMDYRVGERDVLSTGLLLNLRGGTDATISDYSELDAAQLLLDRYQRVRDSRSDGNVLDYTLGFKRTLQPQRHELSGEVRVNRSTQLDRTDLWRQPVGAGSVVDAEIDRTDERTVQVTGQVDYTRGLGARTKLETGYKGYVRWLDRDFGVQRDSLGTGTFTRSDLSNALQLDEQVNAVYGVLSGGVGRFELQGGLRAEYAGRTFSLANSGEEFPHNYWSVFPSALASYKLGEQDQLKVSYSRRIRRPGSQELNPFPVFFDLQNVFLGNPELNPEYTDAVELGYQHSARWGSLQVSPFYRRTSDVIRFIINTADSVAGREVTSVSFENLDTGTSWGADLNGSLRVGQAFSGFGGFNVFKMVTEGTGGESSLSSQAVTWSARVNGTFNLTPRTSFTAAYFYRAPMNIERGRFDAFGFANFSMRQKVYGEKASVTVRVSDPFNQQRFRVRAGDDNVIQLTERAQTSRAVHVAFQYNFGRPPRLRQRPQEQQPQPSSPFGG
ncbi:TonB-dependent receptor domain-containing protein [Longimicrobium sp.]|uniref:TonB-dependent receptor domain-containing protein n=1 Tax=Longimicrobium sp. TaxID=2029185 RepID=UPI002CDE1C38|nr:TonB-dependent receptor [Longimicrobium sp.]HSU17536.1 TonB-dependent receptor [Longimicrobium sp.]